MLTTNSLPRIQPALRSEDPRPAAVRPDSAQQAHLTAEVHASLGSLERLWRAMEADGVCSPYQRFDWIQAYIAAMTAREGSTVRFLVVHGSSGPLLILPLAIRRRRGVGIASPIGGKQANYHLPVMAYGAAAALHPPAVRKLLRDAGRRLGADVYDFRTMPLSWEGEHNPLVLPQARPSPSNAPKTDLPSDAQTLLERLGTSESRRKLRRKEESLARLGELRYHFAETQDDVDRILAAFFRQKGERFRQQGIVDPFEDEASRGFIRQASLTGLGSGRPAIELHGLSLDGQIIATYGGAVDARRFSCMFNSFESSPSLARYSPGDVLLTHVIRTQCRLGRTALDLGVGEARYKSFFCKDVEELVDVLLTVTVRGDAYAAALTRLLKAKHFVKRTPWAWSVVLGMRAARAKLTAPSGCGASTPADRDGGLP